MEEKSTVNKTEDKNDPSGNNTEKKKNSQKGFNPIQVLVLHVIIIVLIIYTMFGLVIGAQYAPNDDMSPNVKSGDLVIYYRLVSEYKVQDVVLLNKNGTEYLGRIVASSGDMVEVTESEELIINGNVINEKNIYSTTPMYEGFVNYPVHLGEDEFFVLVDSRNGGEDSRYYGIVNRSELRGKSIMIIRRDGI